MVPGKISSDSFEKLGFIFKKISIQIQNLYVDGKKIKRPLFFSPHCCLYPAKDDLKLKEIQSAEPPGLGLPAEGPQGGHRGGGGGASRGRSARMTNTRSCKKH